MALTTESFESVATGNKEKIVYIRRAISFAQAQQNDPEVKEYFDSSFKAIGSSFKEFGTQLATGLSFKEEEILMGMLLGVRRDDAKVYNDEVVRFYKNINTKIPSEGLRLNIALTRDNDGPIGEDNLPVNPKDYVIYRHAIVHHNVAMSEEEAEMIQWKQFYIDDPDKSNEEKVKLGNAKDDASVAYIGLRGNDEKVRTVLSILGERPDMSMTAEERYEELRKYAEVNQALNVEGNLARFKKFIDAVEDKRGETKYLISRMVDAGLLTMEGQRYLIEETNDEIGVGLEDTSLWLLDKKNSKEVNMLKTKLKELGK